MKLNICINDQTPNRGFFSFFNQVLDALDWADKNHEYMAVDFSHGPFAYGEWDDYFEQPYRVGFRSWPRRFDKKNKQMWFDSTVFCSRFFLTNEEIKRGAYLLKKYIRINKIEIVGSVGIIGERVLGVHCRQTDHGLHGDLLPVKYYIENAKHVMRERDLDKVYLATDSFQAQQEFLDAFGSQLIIQNNTCKSINSDPIQLLGFDPVRIGKEAITDVINLSNCAYLLKTASNLSHAVLFFNPNLKYENIDSHIEYK